MRAAIRASAANPAPAPSVPAKTAAPDAGGGSRAIRRNAGCTLRTLRTSRLSASWKKRLHRRSEPRKQSNAQATKDEAYEHHARFNRYRPDQEHGDPHGPPRLARSRVDPH